MSRSHGASVEPVAVSRAVMAQVVDPRVGSQLRREYAIPVAVVGEERRAADFGGGAIVRVLPSVSMGADFSPTRAGRLDGAGSPSTLVALVQWREASVNLRCRELLSPGWRRVRRDAVRRRRGQTLGSARVAAKQRSSWGKARGPAGRPRMLTARSHAGIEQDTRLDPLASRSGSGAARGTLGRMRASVSYGRRLADGLTSDRQLEPSRSRSSRAADTWLGRRPVVKMDTLALTGSRCGQARAALGANHPPPRARSPSAGTLGVPVPACQGADGWPRRDSGGFLRDRTAEPRSTAKGEQASVMGT